MNSSLKPKNHVAAIIVAAGDGTRMGGGVPKAYRLLVGRPLVEYSIEQFLSHEAVDDIVVIYNINNERYISDIKSKYNNLVCVHGGVSRQESVRLGLEALAGRGITHVLIHDAARPFVNTALIDRVLAGLGECQAALPVTAITDTIRRVDADKIGETINRDILAAAQTPQGFSYDVIASLHVRYADKSATDDVQLAQWAEIPVAKVEGDRDNTKLTYPKDWNMAEQQMNQCYLPRVGFGFDVHKLIPHEESVPDRHRVIRLGGVDIVSGYYLEGHSDADVVLHAVTDAILGALAEGDIGVHFPPTEPKWRGVDSSIFLIESKALCMKYNAKIQNVDITIIAQHPTIAPHRTAIRERLAEILNISLNRVSVKATTSEGLGFTGRAEGIASQAVVCLMVPDDGEV